MTPHQLASAWNQHTATWYERAAALAVGHGWFQVIPERRGSDLLLLRCWLSPPLPGTDGGFEAGDSLLLHYFLRGDDDGALHDHPWDFVTTILAGGYVEHIGSAHDGFGPGLRDCMVDRLPGPIPVIKRAEDLHCVGSLIGKDAWTLVRTGPKRRSWGFHPPGKRWISGRDYLNPSNY